MHKKDYSLVYYLLLLGFGVLAPLLFPSLVKQFTLWWLFIVLAFTWDLQGGQMGYNSFGNIIFFGIGMYVGTSTQIALFFELGAWTELGGLKTFVHTPGQYLGGLAAGIALAPVVAALTALLIGLPILTLRGHYFSICTLALGIAVGEIFAGIEVLGAGSGMSVPVWPKTLGAEDTPALVFYFLSLGLFALTFPCFRALVQSHFGLTLNAIRDNEEKAEAMGIYTTQHKVLSWIISAFFLGLAGAIFGPVIGFIDPIDVAFSGPTIGVWMILMVIMGGKGTLWGPVIGATMFHLFQELFWTYLFGWQRISLGALIVVIVLFFPKGVMGWLSERSAAKELAKKANAE